MSAPRPPVALFVFSRPLHTQRTLEALANNPGAGETDLHVFSDGPRVAAERERVDEVRRIVGAATGFRSIQIHESPVNRGLVRSLREGIDQILRVHDRVIVLEDDIKTAPGFLNYLAQALDHYAGDPKVRSVTGYRYPLGRDFHTPADTFLFPRFNCWGWGTWKDRWEEIDWSLPNRGEFLRNREPLAALSLASNDLPEILLDRIDGNNQSWAIQVALDHVKKGGYAVYPAESLVENIGLDGSGTHFASRSVRAADAEKFRITGLGAAPDEFRFDDQLRPDLVQTVRSVSANSLGRRLKNLARYGRAF
jgi:hypothetical protein